MLNVRRWANSRPTTHVHTRVPRERPPHIVAVFSTQERFLLCPHKTETDFAWRRRRITNSIALVSPNSEVEWAEPAEDGIPRVKVLSLPGSAIWNEAELS